MFDVPRCFCKLPLLFTLEEWDIYPVDGHELFAFDMLSYNRLCLQLLVVTRREQMPIST